MKKAEKQRRWRSQGRVPPSNSSFYHLWPALSLLTFMDTIWEYCFPNQPHFCIAPQPALSLAHSCHSFMLSKLIERAMRWRYWKGVQSHRGKLRKWSARTILGETSGWQRKLWGWDREESQRGARMGGCAQQLTHFWGGVPQGNLSLSTGAMPSAVGL